MRTLNLSEYTTITNAVVEAKALQIGYNNISAVQFCNQNFTIADGLTEFSKMPNLEKLYNINLATNIGSHAFENCPLTGTLWLDRVTEEIGDYAFANTKITRCAFNKTAIKKVGNFSFFNNKELSTINALENLTNIGSHAFENCPLTVNISLNVLTCSNNSFKNTAIERIYFTGTSKVEDSAFQNCLNLKYITGLTAAITIGSHAFENCPLTGTLWLDKVTKEIGDYAFANTKITRCAIPTVTNVKPHAFENCNQLSVANLNNANNIGDYVFASCYNFPDKISLPKCTEIGRYAFLSCQNLSSLNAPQCTFVDYNAFYGTKLWDVDPQQ